MSELLLDERTIPFDGVDEDFRDHSVEYEELMIEPVTPQDMHNSKGNKKMAKTTKEKPGRREKIPSGTLCVVCSDFASGIHYGVPSCNGCKTFFRRALVNKQAFQCQFANDCMVDKSVRCGCRSCRLKKCFRMGMDPRAIQNDRDKIRYSKRHHRGSVDEKDEKSPTMISNSAQIDERHANGTTCDFPLISNVMICSRKTPNHPETAKTSPMPMTNDALSERLQTEAESLVRDLLEIENRMNRVRQSTTFVTRNATSSCMYDECLLRDEQWINANTAQSSRPAPSPVACDTVRLRCWFVRDIRLMIEWVKCLRPTVDALLLNDKMALIKAFAPVFPLIQLAFYSDDRSIFSSHSPFGLDVSPISHSSSISNASPGCSSALTAGRESTMCSRLCYPDGSYLEEPEDDADSTSHAEAMCASVILILLDVCSDLRRLRVRPSHLVLFKVTLFFNPDAPGLTQSGKAVIERRRQQLLGCLHAYIASERPARAAVELFSYLMMLTATLNRVASIQLRAFEVARIFDQSNDLIDELLSNNS